MMPTTLPEAFRTGTRGSARSRPPRARGGAVTDRAGGSVSRAAGRPRARRHRGAKTRERHRRAGRSAGRAAEESGAPRGSCSIIDRDEED